MNCYLLFEVVLNIRLQSGNADNFVTVKARTETYKKSFIPSAAQLWNKTPAQERTLDFIKDTMSSKSTLLYCVGSRDANIKHAQLRMKCSKLNDHLFNLHVIESSACPCGHKVESSEHYFLKCPLYDPQRKKMFRDIKKIITCDTVTLDMILYGMMKYDFDKNKQIFECVHEFIKESGRL